MLIDLAYPYTDPAGGVHAPDETVDVPDEVGQQMVHDGVARVTPAAPVTEESHAAPAAPATPDEAALAAPENQGGQ